MFVNDVLIPQHYIVQRLHITIHALFSPALFRLLLLLPFLFNIPCPSSSPSPLHSLSLSFSPNVKVRLSLHTLIHVLYIPINYYVDEAYRRTRPLLSLITVVLHVIALAHCIQTYYVHIISSSPSSSITSPSLPLVVPPRYPSPALVVFVAAVPLPMCYGSSEDDLSL